MTAHEQEAAVPSRAAAPCENPDGIELVSVIAEATDGVSVWYASEAVPAHQWDEHSFVRTFAEASVRAKLTAEAPAGLTVTVRTDRWTMTLGSEEGGRPAPAAPIERVDPA